MMGACGGMVRAVLVGTLSLAGCTSSHDLRPDSQYPSDYSIGAVYRTREELITLKGLLSVSRPALHLEPGDYLGAPPPPGGAVLGTHVVVPKGTLILFETFTWVDSMLGSFVETRGRFLDGPLADEEVELRDISRHLYFPAIRGRGSEAELHIVDPRYLERIR